MQIIIINFPNGAGPSGNDATPGNPSHSQDMNSKLAQLRVAVVALAAVVGRVHAPAPVDPPDTSEDDAEIDSLTSQVQGLTTQLTPLADPAPASDSSASTSGVTQDAGSTAEATTAKASALSLVPEAATAEVATAEAGDWHKGNG